MKICIITNLFKPYSVGGAESYAETIAKELAKENKVVVITTRAFSGLNSLKPSVENQNGLQIYRFYPINIYFNYYLKRYPAWIKPLWHIIDIWNPHSYFAVKKIIKKEKPDIVHTLNLSGLSTSVFAAVKASRGPHVHTVLDGALISPWAVLSRNGKMITFNFFDRQYMRIKRFLSKSADIVLASYHFLLDIHLENGYFEGLPVRVFPYPARLYPPVLKGKSYIPINLLYVGAIAKGKGIYVLLDAFKKLDRNDVNLHFVGMGSEVEELRRAAHSQNNVYIHDYISDEALADMYSRANITIVPTLFPEDNPLIIIESFSFGTPVIASNLNGIPETIADGVNGRLFEPGDSLALKDALEDLISNHDKLREMEAEALKSAEKYSLGKHISNLLEIYRSLGHASPL